MGPPPFPLPSMTTPRKLNPVFRTIPADGVCLACLASPVSLVARVSGNIGRQGAKQPKDAQATLWGWMGITLYGLKFRVAACCRDAVRSNRGQVRPLMSGRVMGAPLVPFRLVSPAACKACPIAPDASGCLGAARSARTLPLARCPLAGR